MRDCRSLFFLSLIINGVIAVPWYFWVLLSLVVFLFILQAVRIDKLERIIYSQRECFDEGKLDKD